MSAPPTRWDLAKGHGYGERFRRLLAEGEDVDGEARLADALVPREARILDVGSGMGRVSAALLARGHDVVAVERDPTLVAQSRSTYPYLDVVHGDILDADLRPGFDLTVMVGNVMVFLAEGTERNVLTRLHGLLGPSGRMLVGFHPTEGPASARDYPPEEFSADAEASGFHVDMRLSSYELRPAAENYTVWVLSR